MNSASPRDRLLPPYLAASTLTAAIAWLFSLAMQQSAAFDLTGHVETLVPLARLGVVSAPIIVALRAGVAALTAWLVAGALGAPLSLGSVAAGVLCWLPLLELPAVVDATAMLLAPSGDWNATHIGLGLDAWFTGLTGRARILTQTMHPGWFAFAALLWHHLRRRMRPHEAVALPAALASALVLALLPLLRNG
jgi:hypothetical protein